MGAFGTANGARMAPALMGDTCINETVGQLFVCSDIRRAVCARQLSFLLLITNNQ